MGETSATRGVCEANPNAPARARVDFMIVGAQKSGTTALARFLGQHPEIEMSAVKEPHVFDSPDFSPDWSSEEIDERYARHFHHKRGAQVRLRGEATPIYMYWRGVPPLLARYNPNLKIIVLLRDPVERALSNYAMQVERGREKLPLWLALLLEPIRLRLSERSRREHSYRDRGLYSRQLETLRICFPPANILAIRNRDLLVHHDCILRQAFAFLGARGDVSIPRERVYPPIARANPNFVGRKAHPLSAAALRASYALESARLRRILQAGGLVVATAPD